jgi:glutamine amidotransferase-like uncharacterized protein
MSFRASSACNFVVACLFFTAPFTARAATSEDSAIEAPIRVALYADSGAAKKGSKHVKRCLAKEHGFAYELVTAQEIRDGVLARFDVVIHPGGSGSQQAEALGDEGREKVRDFVATGNGFVGICAGAYLASAEYPWSLNLVDAKVLDRKHWARGTGDVELRLTPAARRFFGIEDEMVTIYYGQGPLLSPAANDAIVDYEPLALYETEVAKNGAPAGVMKGTTAIARAPFGKGRVVAISPHPERTPGRDEVLQRAIRWTAGED